MMPNSSDVAIAFIVREKFGWALESLKQLYAHSREPFALYIVDCGYPPEIRAQMESFLEGRRPVEWITADRFLWPSEALNLVTARATESFLCRIENDVLVAPGFLDFLLETMRDLDCEIVAPLTLEAEPGHAPTPHRDDGGGTQGVFAREPDGGLSIFERRFPATENGRLRVHRFELHALLFRTAALRAISPLPNLNSREHLDLALRAWDAGYRAYLDRRSVCTYMYPPLDARDKEFFRFRWNPAAAQRSHAYVKATWRIRRMPRAMDFVRRHQDFLREENVLRTEPSADGSIPSR